MCGIAGFCSPGLPQEEGTLYLRRMLRAIEHRGPDGEGSWSNASLGLHLGMRRLSIIDLHGGNQPIWNENQTVAVFFNGEIYNYIELRRELEAAGHVFRTQSDTEVLVHLYERDGQKMFRRLRGMFAIALFDTQTRRILVARDGAGQKPFFYYRDAHRFAFASEIKALFMLPFVPDVPNSEAFLDYVAWLSLPAPMTHFQAVQKLPPGSFMEIDPDQPMAGEVHSFLPEESDAPLADIEEAVSALDAALKESVAIHLRSDVPVGVLLSSGIDSQTIAAYVQDIRPGQLSSFTAIFDGKESEQTGAEETARMVNSRHFSITLSPGELEQSIAQAAWYLDEPIGDPAAFAVHKICEFARNHVKVVLGGEGSDELFGGYTNRYEGILQTLARSNQIRQWLGWLPFSGKTDYSRSWNRLLRRVHLTEGQEAVSLRTEGFPGDIRTPQVLTSSDMARLDAHALRFSQTTYDKKNGPLEALLHMDRRWQLPESLLVKGDRMSMAASIELRSPFLDGEIIKLADRMVMGLKIPPGGAGKWILFKCLERRFPTLLRREKKGFPIPLSQWFRGPLRSTVEETLFRGDSVLREHLDLPRLKEAWQFFLKGSGPSLPFYALWLYDHWHREFPRRIETLRKTT